MRLALTLTSPARRPPASANPDPPAAASAGRPPGGAAWPDECALQVLGAIVYADRPQPVAWLARDLGANRQNVQRIINDLLGEGLVELVANPHHRRASLVIMTEKGQRTYDAALRLYDPAANALADGLSVEDIETARRVLSELRNKLEGGEDADERA